MTETRWLDQREGRAWAGFRDMQRHLDIAIESQLAECGLSHADYEVLVRLSQGTDRWIRARDLGRAMGWDRSRLAHHMRRMEERGLIRRRPAPDDARGTDVQMTAEGRRTLTRTAPGHVETVRRHLIDVLTTAQLEALAAISGRVLAVPFEVDSERAAARGG